MYLVTESGRRLTTEDGRYLVTRLVVRLFPTAFRLAIAALGLDPARTTLRGRDQIDPARTALLPPEPAPAPAIDPTRTTLLEL